MVLFTFVTYLAAVIGIGLWAARHGDDTQEDYFLAGRSFSPLVTALSAVSSGRSAWLLMGAAVAAWKLGLSAIWYFPGYIVVEAVLFVTLGRRLRERSSEVGAITIPEFIDRFTRITRASSADVGADTGAQRTNRLPVRPIAALAVVLFLTTYVSAQLVAGGKALAHVVDVDGRTWGLTITAGIVLVYTFLGGYRAVALTDVLQAILMLTGLLVLPVLTLHHVGGFERLFEQLRAIDPALCEWQRGFWPLASGLAIGLGSIGNPHILVRYMSIKDPRALRTSALIGTTWNVVMAAGALCMGLAGRALYADASAFPRGDTDYLFPLLAEFVSNEYLFSGFVGILLATLFAAIMSTCDSQLLVVASSLVRDFRGSPSTRGGLVASRVTVFATVVAAVAMSFGAKRVVDSFVLASWGALGAAFGPVLIALLYRRRTSAGAALAGIVTGAAVAVGWQQLPLVDGPDGALVSLKAATGVYELLPAFAASFVAILGVDLRSRG